MPCGSGSCPHDYPQLHRPDTVHGSRDLPAAHAAAGGAFTQALPVWFSEWLELIPAAILSALLASTLLTSAESRAFCLGKPELLAAVPTLLVALKTRSLAGTVIVGMVCYWGLKLVM